MGGGGERSDTACPAPSTLDDVTTDRSELSDDIRRHQLRQSQHQLLQSPLISEERPGPVVARPLRHVAHEASEVELQGALRERQQ